MAERGRPRSFDRQRALELAMEVFWAKGYAGTSMFDLTSTLGISSPSLYAAFGSKDELFREVVELYKTTVGDGIWRKVVAAETARAGIEAMLRATAERFGGSGRGCLMVLAAVHDRANDAGVEDPIYEELHELRKGPVEILRARLLRAASEGELPKSANIEAITNFYITLQQGMSLRARDNASRAELLALVDGAMHAWDGFTSPT